MRRRRLRGDDRRPECGEVEIAGGDDLRVYGVGRRLLRQLDVLLRDVWEYDNLIDTRTVDTHMRRLREKLGPVANHLETVRGVGYMFVPPKD